MSGGIFNNCFFNLNIDLKTYHRFAMKFAFYTIIVTCLFYNAAYAQNDIKSKKFINEIIARDHIVYLDSVGQYAVRCMREGLELSKNHIYYSFKNDSVVFVDSARRRKLISRDQLTRMMRNDRRGTFKEIKKDSLSLTDKEYAYVLSEIKKMQKFIWHDDLLPASKTIPTDTVTNIFTTRKMKGWDYLRKVGIRGIFTVAKPIFLRSNTVCLFYFDQSCGYVCGSGEFAAYKKVNGKWVHWITLDDWTS